MKTNIVGIIIALILTFVGMLSVYAQDTKVSEVRKVDAFSSIEITSVGTIYFTQSDTYSFKIEGKEKHVKNTETTVKDGCLLIGFKDRKNKSMRNQKDGVTIWISAPDLKKVEFTGVGEFNCEKPLKLDEVSFRLFGKYTAVCAGIQPDAESSGSGCKHIAAWLHLWLGVVVLLCAELTKFRYSRMACIKNRDCKCIGRTFA